jgi:hypothetical protein
MQLQVEQGMGASRLGIQATWSGEARAGVAQYRGGEPSATVVRALSRLSSRTTGQSEPDGSQRLEVSALASFAGAKRSQWAVLTEAEVLAGVRGVVTGVTCLANPRPSAPRLALAPIVLIRDQAPHLAFSKRATAKQEVDVGGIYSW